MTTTISYTDAARRAAECIKNLDLSLIRRKLQEPAPEGQGWTDDQARLAEKWYRRYLLMLAKYPDRVSVPNGPIDTFWHQHILDTHKYAEDCDEIFGHFVHHYPYFGLNGDAAERDEAFVDTNDRYRREFGEDCTSLAPHFRVAPEDCTPAGEFLAAEGMNCNSGGSTGCGQRIATAGTNCNSGGSTGCGQRIAS